MNLPIFVSSFYKQSVLLFLVLHNWTLGISNANTTVAELNGARDRSPRLLIIIYWQTSEYLVVFAVLIKKNVCKFLFKLYIHFFRKVIINKNENKLI